MFRSIRLISIIKSVMPIVTAIKFQKNQKRVNIYLDGKFGFGIDLENFVKLGLKVEQELSDKEIEEIVKKSEFQKTLEKLLRFAALRPRSEKEIKSWLYRKRVHESLQKDLFNRLKKLKLVDDKEFARWWTEQRLTFRPKSIRIMNYELRIKGIKDEIIREVLEELKIDEGQSARKILEKVKYKWERLKENDRRRKISDYLARHGFGWTVIEKILKKV